MADMNTALKVLRDEFPRAVVGLDNYRPYAKLPSGEIFGIYFAEGQHAGDPIWARGPSGIIKFSGSISSRNYEIVANLSREGDKIVADWLCEKPVGLEARLQKLGLTEEEALLELDALNERDCR